jgi:glycogen debranching enzyme
MSRRLVNSLAANTFVVSDAAGDIEASPVEFVGLFSFDTRFLSRWVLTVNGARLNALSTDDIRYFESRFFLAPGPRTVYLDTKLSVIRHRSIFAGLCETVTVMNHGEEPIDVGIRLEAGSDFADPFELKDATPKKGQYYRRVVDGRLVFGYERASFRRETTVSASTPAQLDEDGFTFVVQIEPQQDWTTELTVEPAIIQRGKRIAVSAMLHIDSPTAREDVERDLDEWLRRAPRLECDYEPLPTIYRRCLIDLAALRFPTPATIASGMPAAGLPWFMAVFGRDSILTSLQALPFAPELASSTIRELGGRQGTRSDDFRDEDPGRIIHEIRLGETAAFGEQPHSPYFGSADATPLFVVLLDEYERWTGDAQLARDYEFEARAALAWIDEYADLLGMGYIAYQRRNEQTGLENQCWKDSWDSISYHDGRLPGFPRATCELQGYAYDAKMRGARLARRFWNDPLYADALERDAADLKIRFNRDFWMEDKHYYALALDADGSQVDALSSNIGHLLWSGIVDETKADAVVRQLMDPHMFSGWGVRTLSSGEKRYNPIGYHVGTVWPFDNSFIAWGMRRYGFKQEAALLAENILQAADFFGGRLPEAFAGYDRALTKYPVEYPTACSPQAWSTGTPLLFMRTMLGLEPIDDHLATDAFLPDTIGYLALINIPGPWGNVDARSRRQI